jgi:hypothetical protein
MKPFAPAAWLHLILASQILCGQAPKIDRKAFFEDPAELKATIITNVARLYNNHSRNGHDFPGIFLTTLPDGTQVHDSILLEVRGNFRLAYCYIPPIRIIFNSSETAVLHSLKTMKLVNQCKVSSEYDQYILKEFIAYKIYNAITDLSIRPRLLNLTWQDSAGKKKPAVEHAILLEDIKDVAKRNDCILWTKPALHQELTNRHQMTLVSLFQYMIGNTDWGASANHNQRLLVSKKDSLGRPLAVAYDFDEAGLVNPEYAVPNEKLGIETVRERVYRGFPRTMAELNEAFVVFNNQKDKIYSMIKDFNLLTPVSKKEMIEYLDEFYTTINSPDLAKSTFIDNARTN